MLTTVVVSLRKRVNPPAPPKKWIFHYLCAGTVSNKSSNQVDHDGHLSRPPPPRRFVYGLSLSYHMSGENLVKFLLRDA